MYVMDIQLTMTTGYKMVYIYYDLYFITYVYKCVWEGIVCQAAISENFGIFYISGFFLSFNN